MVKIIDHGNQTVTVPGGASESTGLPSSNVVQFLLEDGSKITARPSGTEPKIKFYFSVKGSLISKDAYASTEKLLEARIDALVEALGLNA